jgi:hypothetical protein
LYHRLFIFSLSNLDDQKKKGQHHSLRRSNSTESFNHIPLVDDQSLDSTSGNNTESDQPKQRSVKSQKKDVETNTDSRNGNHQQRKQGEFFSSSSLPLSIFLYLFNLRYSMREKKKETIDKLAFFFFFFLELIRLNTFILRNNLIKSK